MRFTLWTFALVLALSTGHALSVRAAEPMFVLKGGPVTAHTSPAVRLEVVVANLWDVLWKNSHPRTLTGQTRYGWKWLAARFDKDRDGVITPDEFAGSSELFASLDRNWDGKLTREDFDWTGSEALGRQKATTFALFKAIDTSSNGRITSDEWQAAFEKMAKEKGYLNDQELEELIFRPAIVKAQREAKTFDRQSPPRSKRLSQLLESGKLFTDGPRPGELAPDFFLRSPDGKKRVCLSSYRGDKPVVLVFGSFT